MTLDQIEHFVRESRDAQRRWTHIMVEGGEPTHHRNMGEILSMLLNYPERHSPECRIILCSNGYGSKVQQALMEVPRGVTIYNSQKTSQEHIQFDAFNDAPIDRDQYRGADFSRFGLIHHDQLKIVVRIVQD